MSELSSSDSSPVISTVSLDVLEWKCHPITRKPLISIGVCLLICIVPVLVFVSTQSAGFALLAMVMLFASLAKFFFPTCYRLDETGITVKTMTQTLTKPWSMYRSYYTDPNGVLLSPFAEPSRLENFRGLYVMFSNNKDTVVAHIQSHITQTATDTKESA